MSEQLHEEHRARMYERVQRDGLDSLAEHEALEYLLFLSIPRQDTNELAHRLIKHFGSFCAVMEASEEELQKEIYAVSEKVYKAAAEAQGAAGQNGGAQPGAGAAGSDPNVYEADYTDVDDNNKQ